MRKVKLWTSLGIAAVSTSLITDSAASASQIAPFANTRMILAAAGEGGEGGNQSQNIGADVEFLTDLGLLEGHVIVGMDLYKRGDKTAAIHLKLAKDEAYKDLEPALQSRNLPGFAKNLADLIAASNAGGPSKDVDGLYAKVSNAIKAARKSETEASAIAGAAQRLARHAADEYADGVKDGKIVEVTDYQSAWGFIEAARHMMAGLSAKARKRNKDAVTEIEAELEKLKPVWPDLTGKQPVTADPTLLPAAASRIELAAFSIK